MQQLWPLTNDVEFLHDLLLEELYAYPDPPERPWVQANMVMSVDGGFDVDGRSRPLSSPGDQRIFMLGRDLADVILVGWGTAHAEGYRGVQPHEVDARRRERLGRAPLPSIAVVSGCCSVPPDSPLVTDSHVQLIVITTEAAPATRRAALRRAGADVIIAGDERVDLGAMLAALGQRKLLRVDCEGGPQLLGALLAADLVDQLCLTIAPLLAGSGGRSVPLLPRRLALVSVLHDAGGHLLLRYRRGDGATSGC